jgi:S-DNA-T family DNA segregation ATPase FtsK/SpoIIIE
MKNFFSSLIARYHTILFFSGAAATAYGIASTMAAASAFLTYSTHITVHNSFFATLFIYAWHLCGSAIWFIPVALFCFGITRFMGVHLFYEHYCAAIMWVVSSALVAGLYHVDNFATGAGGLIGVYGALWLRTILGLLGTKLLLWFVWMSCAFVVAYDLLMIAARSFKYGGTKIYGWYVRYKTKKVMVQTPAVFESIFDNPSTEDLAKVEIVVDVQSMENNAESTVFSATLSNYQKPNLGVFVATKDTVAQEKLSRELQDKAQLLTEKLERFGVSGTVVTIKRGPVVTLYEYQPHMDTKISKIIALEDDLALALQALSIRIIAPIPGKSVVGFEVANSERQPVTMAALVHSDAFTKSSAQLPCILGVDTTGDPVVADLARMPHLLIAGSTGSGKSVALNTLLTSLLCSRTPDECRLILIDPKRIEFAVYADIPHLLFPIVTDARTASLVLKWVVKHMEERYTILAQHGVRSSREFNQRVAAGMVTENSLPSLVIVIDELADLMITAGRDVEESIARIAQMARAAGIHLVVATQRPSVDVITGLIKVNFPSRMAFRVASRIDSRTILDIGGADKLLGKGDMLFLDGTSAQLQRLHGAYVSDEEIHAVVLQVKRAGRPQYKDLQAELATIPTDTAPVEDGLYQEVISYLKEVDEISISLLQRKFRIGYNRSARLIDLLEQQGLIMPPDGARPRKVVR